MKCDLCGRPIKWSYDTGPDHISCCSACWREGEDPRFSSKVANSVGPFDYGTGGGKRVIRETKTS